MQEKRSALSLLKNSGIEEKVTKPNIIEKTESSEKSIEAEKSELIPGRKVPMKRKPKSKKEKMAYALTIDPDIHKLLKLHASFTNIPMSQTVEELLTKFFEKNKDFKEALKNFMQ